MKWPIELSRSRWLVPLIAGTTFLVFAVLFLAGKGQNAAPSGEIQSKPSETGGDSVVTLDSTALKLVGIETTIARASGAAALTANGTITFDANHTSIVAPRSDGRVASLRADLGQEVKAGSVLAIIESSDVGQARGDLARARSNVEVSRANYEREKRLYSQSVSSQKEMLDAQAAFRSAEADYNTALARIRSLGALGGSGGSYGLTTAITGTVVERNATPGQIVGPTTNLFTVADLSRVWIAVDLYESDANSVHAGTSAIVSPRSLPGETFPARVTFAGGVIDSATHTVKLRLEILNPARRLRPGMFAEIRFETPAKAAETIGGASVVVPEDAVQDINGKTVVFLPKGSRGRFVARPVTVSGTAIDRMVTVISGLRSGEQVVVKGAFQLKAELIKGSFGKEQD